MGARRFAVCTVRALRPEDAAEIGRIACANGQPSEDSCRDPRYVAHLARHGRLLVADAGVAETPGTGVRLGGFAATRHVGEVTLLCDLFVDPERHGSGIGRMLLDRIFDGTTDRVTFSSQDPRALPLYARYGLAPRWPLLYLAGDPAALVAGAATPRWTGQARRVLPSDAAAAEHALTGVDRGPDYSYWGCLRDSGGLLVEQAHDVVAAGAIGPADLRHLAVTDGAEPAVTVLAALSAFASPAGRAPALASPGDGPPTVRLCLPGPHPALGALLRSGFRVDDFDHYMSTGDGLVHTGHVLSPALA